MPQSGGEGEGGWRVYLLRCGDGSLYCGVTNDLAARLVAHRAGKGARYTRGRGPLRVVWVEACADRGAALSREHAVKRLPRAAKRALVRSYSRVSTVGPLATTSASRTRPRKE